MYIRRFSEDIKENISTELFGHMSLTSYTLNDCRSGEEVERPPRMQKIRSLFGTDISR